MNNEVCWNQITQYNNVKVKSRRFKVGDRVLKKLEVMSNDVTILFDSFTHI